MKTGIELIAKERENQKKKWDSNHDAMHDLGELRKVAAILCCQGTDAVVLSPDDFNSENDVWGLPSKHSENPIKRLQIAGALIAAEIDRMQHSNDSTIPRKDMTDSENSLRILNALPGRIIYKGNYYMLITTKIDFGGENTDKYGFGAMKWYIEYQRITTNETVFKTTETTIEKAAFEMFEILTENKLIC